MKGNNMSDNLELKLARNKRARKVLVTLAVSVPIVFWLISWLG